MNRIAFYITFIFLFSTSCKQKNSQPLLPHIIGAMNDVVLVMSVQNWESEPGEVMRKGLTQFVPAIPQEEPIFDIIWMPHGALSRAIKKQRNIIITKIGPEHKPNISYHKSLWAQSQMVIQITAQNQKEFIALFNKNEKQIINRIQDAELERLMRNYKKSQEWSIHKKILSKHQIDIVVPKGYTINLESDNFIWLDNRHHNVIEGILVYYYPYSDSNTFTTEYLIEKRNSIFQKYIPGEKEGSHPTTEMRFPTQSYEYKLNGKRYTYELRGLWNVVGGLAMGGPFISITQYDEERERIVTIDGFLFAPGEDKRNLLKRIEAILYSLEFKDGES